MCVNMRNQPNKPKIKQQADDKMVHVYFKVNGVTCPFVKGRVTYLKAFNLRERIKAVFNQLNLEQHGQLIFTQ